MGSSSGTTTTNLLGAPEDPCKSMQVTHEHLAVALYSERRDAAVHREEILVEGRGNGLEEGQPVLARSAERDAPRGTDVRLRNDLGYLPFLDAEQDNLLTGHEGEVERTPATCHRQLGVRCDGR